MKKWLFGCFPNYLGFKRAFRGKNLAATISRYLLSKYHLTFTKEAVSVPATVYEDGSVEAIHPVSASFVRTRSLCSNQEVNAYN